MSFLSLSGVTASYGATQALFGVDLSLNEGEFLALMGRNGMGKSTTIKVICRMIKHQDGEVSFAGRDMRGLPSHRSPVKNLKRAIIHSEDLKVGRHCDHQRKQHAIGIADPCVQARL